MKKDAILTISHMDVSTEGKSILTNISLSVGRGQVHAVMGPNGSGKSTLLYALMAHPSYRLSGDGYAVTFDNSDITELPTEERARRGLFLALQSPVAIPGVSVVQILRSALTDQTGGKAPVAAGYNPALARARTVAGGTLAEFMKSVQQTADTLRISRDLLSRGIHDGFSGGERKKMEILEALLLKPKLALFDEIDTGLDVDALRIVAAGIAQLQRQGTTVVIVTHYQRILKFLKPDRVHLLVRGSLIASGGAELAGTIDRKGYGEYAKPVSAS